jgi:hypothetical protein
MRRWSVVLTLTTFVSYPALSHSFLEDFRLTGFLGPDTIPILLIPITLLIGAWYIREDAKARPFQAVGHLGLLAIALYHGLSSDTLLSNPAHPFLGMSALAGVEFLRPRSIDPERRFAAGLLLLLSLLHLSPLTRLFFLPQGMSVPWTFIAVNSAPALGGAALFGVSSWGLRQKLAWAPWVGGLGALMFLLLDLWTLSASVLTTYLEARHVIVPALLLEAPGWSLMAAAVALLSRDILRRRRAPSSEPTPG